jgi:citrate lyase subunit beta/citryl-CoA lyase
MLFVPANVDRFVNKAHERDADAIILDLEDSVPLAEKAAARLRIGSAAQLVARAGADVIVRINSSLRLAAADLETAVDARVAAICIPKVSSAEQLQWISEAIDQLEIEKQLPLGHTRLIALVESVAALPKLIEIASSTSRLAGLIVGYTARCEIRA